MNEEEEQFINRVSDDFLEFVGGKRESRMSFMMQAEVDELVKSLDFPIWSLNYAIFDLVMCFDLIWGSTEVFGA